MSTFKLPCRLVSSLVSLFSLSLLGVSSIAVANTDVEHRLEHLTGLFTPDTVKVSPEIVSCILSSGSESNCVTITVENNQADHQMGPWCPRHIDDTDKQGGIWLENNRVNQVDGEFIKNLASFYDDDEWQLYNPETGEIKVTDSKKACMAAARPDVDPQYQNYCVECLPEYMEQSTQAYLLPLSPVKLKKSERMNPHGGVGLAYNGIKFDAPAPVEAILGAYTLAPFDDCGGHVNLHAGYHYHAAMGCSKSDLAEAGHAPAIGIAMDGFSLHAELNADGSAATDLDECNGHEFGDLGYHYHANSAGENKIIGCFKGEQGCALEPGAEECRSGISGFFSRLFSKK